MSFPYPAKPWQDGQQVNVAMADGTYVIGQYDASKNLWSFRRFRDDQVNREQIFTFDVLTTTSQPAPRDLSPFDTSDPTNLQTQQEVNWFLWNYIRELEIEGAQISFSTEATMLQAPANIDETFERDVNDLDQYGPALFYINAPDHEGATRIVVPKVDTEGFNWTSILRAYGVDDIILTVQVDDLGTPDDSSDDLNYRSEWRIISDPVENPSSFSFEVKHIKDNPDHLPSFGENVYVRLLASQGYVLKTGDTMTGPLLMDDASILIENGELGFVRTGDTAELSNVDNRFSTIKSASPFNLDTNLADHTKEFGIQVKIDGGNTFKNKFKVNNRNGDIVTVSGGTGPVVDFGDTFGGNQTGYEPGYEGGVVIKGIPTPEFDNTEPTLAVNKEYVDTRDEILQQEIIELEEEIDAIAPSTQRGEWHFDMSKTTPDPGDYYLVNSNNGNPVLTDQYNETDIVVFHNTDANGITNTWAGVELDELIQIFDQPDPDFVLGTIKEIDTARVPNSVWIRFDRERGEGSPDNNPDIKLSRVNIFKAPTGGSASDFVLKTGDEMSGPLKFETAQNDTEYDVQSGQARIVFENTNPDNGNKKTINLFQPGDTNALVTNGYLMSKQGVYTASYLYGWNSSTNATYNPRVYLSSSAGGLYYGSSSKKLTWGNAGVTIEKGRSDSSNGNGFIVKGKIHSSSWTSSSFTDSNGSLLESYHNANGQDAINYNGKITGSKNITTKEYVDSKLPTYKITKSNGNYYIQ